MQNTDGWTWLYFHNFKLSAPPPLWIYDFFKLLSHFSKIIQLETKPYWYTDIYPDNLVSGKRISE